MRFSLTVCDGIVLMEVRGVRCGDVWDCEPVDPTDEYGSHEVYTGSQLCDRVARFRRYNPLPDWGTE
jgi:hypothetical protein